MSAEQHRIVFWFTLSNGWSRRWETVVTIRTDDPITDVYEIGAARLSGLYGDVEILDWQ
jgi:hypothetical protein